LVGISNLRLDAESTDEELSNKHCGNASWEIGQAVRLLRKRILYSVNTWLAYNIARMFYGDIHYAWCSPVFDYRCRPYGQATPPPTSCPADIYRTLVEEVKRRDKHSAKIAENKLGILKGAAIKRECGTITDEEMGEINAIVDAADIGDFSPLLYVIPFDCVAGLVKEVPVSQRAHPLSEEFLIDSLPGDLFDVIKLENGQ
jgi:hypothetical protein